MKNAAMHLLELFGKMNDAVNLLHQNDLHSYGNNAYHHCRPIKIRRLLLQVIQQGC
jgi:hypothetical protein